MPSRVTQVKARRAAIAGGPGRRWTAPLGAALLAAIALTGCGARLEAAVQDRFGADVRCGKVGLMMVAGERETVYQCATVSEEASDCAFFDLDDPTETRPGCEALSEVQSGCFVWAEGQLFDVTAEARTLADIGADNLGC